MNSNTHPSTPPTSPVESPEISMDSNVAKGDKVISVTRVTEVSGGSGVSGGESRSDQHGLVCPRCGCQHLDVIYTRHVWGNKIMRRRACRHCNRRITTSEIRIG